MIRNLSLVPNMKLCLSELPECRVASPNCFPFYCFRPVTRDSDKSWLHIPTLCKVSGHTWFTWMKWYFLVGRIARPLDLSLIGNCIKSTIQKCRSDELHTKKVVLYTKQLHPTTQKPEGLNVRSDLFRLLITSSYGPQLELRVEVRNALTLLDPIRPNRKHVQTHHQIWAQ